MHKKRVGKTFFCLGGGDTIPFKTQENPSIICKGVPVPPTFFTAPTP